MAPRTPEEGKARETIRTVRLGPDDDATLEKRRKERGNLSVSTYLRTLVREDGGQAKGKRRG